MPNETVSASQRVGGCHRIPALIHRWSRVRDQPATKRRSRQSARKASLCLDMILQFMRWVGFSMAVAAVVLAILYPDRTALVY